MERREALRPYVTGARAPGMGLATPFRSGAHERVSQTR